MKQLISAVGRLASRYDERAMDVTKMLAELRQEREHIEEAIMSLERLARGTGKRRGRPPGWLQKIETDTHTPKRRGRPPGSKSKAKGEAA